MKKIKLKSKQISIIVCFLFLFICCRKDQKEFLDFEIDNYSAYYTIPQFYLESFKIRSEVNFTLCIVMKNKSEDKIKFSGNNFHLLRNGKLFKLSTKKVYNVIEIAPKDSLKIVFKNSIAPTKVVANSKVIASKVEQELRRIAESKIVYLTEYNDTVLIRKKSNLKFNVYSVQKVSKELQEIREKNFRDNWGNGGNG